MENNDLYTPISEENKAPSDDGSETAKLRKKGVKTFTIIIVSYILIITTLFLTVYTMATDRTHSDKFTAKASVDIVKPLVKAFALGQEAEITDDMVNGLAAYCIKEFDKSQKKSSYSLSVKGISVNFHEKTASDIYVKISYNGMEIIVNAKADISYDSSDGTIVLDLKEVYAGSIPIAPNLAVAIVTHLPDMDRYLTALDGSVLFADSTVKIPASYKTELYDVDIAIELNEITPKDGYAVVSSSGILDLFDDILNSIFCDD